VSAQDIMRRHTYTLPCYLLSTLYLTAFSNLLSTLTTVYTNQKKSPRSLLQHHDTHAIIWHYCFREGLYVCNTEGSSWQEIQGCTCYSCYTYVCYAYTIQWSYRNQEHLMRFFWVCHWPKTFDQRLQ